MKVPQSLPQIWTGRDLAQATGRSPLNVTEMSSRGLLAPTAIARPAAEDKCLELVTMHDHGGRQPTTSPSPNCRRTASMCPMSKDRDLTPGSWSYEPGEWPRLSRDWVGPFTRFFKAPADKP
jgi:hypothetical protein